MSGMKPYHKAWLSAHPERTEQWLKERLADGFDVHHVNGDHFDDHPDNLALIEFNRPCEDSRVRRRLHAARRSGSATASNRRAKHQSSGPLDWSVALIFQKRSKVASTGISRMQRHESSNTSGLTRRRYGRRSSSTKRLQAHCGYETLGIRIFQVGFAGDYRFDETSH